MNEKLDAYYDGSTADRRAAEEQAKSRVVAMRLLGEDVTNEWEYNRWLEKVRLYERVRLRREEARRLRYSSTKPPAS